MIQEVDGLPKDPSKVSTTTLLSVKVAGNSAVVDQRYDMKTVKTAADGSKANVQLITAFDGYLGEHKWSLAAAEDGNEPARLLQEWPARGAQSQPATIRREMKSIPPALFLRSPRSHFLQAAADRSR